MGIKTEKTFNFNKIKGALCNNTEKYVLETMEELLKKPKFKDVCTCDQCLLDIASYALNRLPAKYIASPRGEIQTRIEKFENQVNVDCISIIIKAIKVVSQNPHHSIPKKKQKK